MRTILISTLILSFFVFTSCQKDLTFDNVDNTNTTPIPPPTSTPPGNQKLFRIQQGVNPDLTDDTIWHISYNAAGKIRTIVDSLAQDTLVANYDASGRLVSTFDSYGDNATYTYNADNQLAVLSYDWAGSKERFLFTYAGGTIQKKSYYSNLGSGALKYLGDFIYTVTGGNITSIKAYTASGTLISTSTFAYGSEPNPLKDLSLFNYANRLGMDYIMDIETYFNKNLWTKATISSASLDFNIVYLFNSQRLTKAMANRSGGGVFTWQFGYR